MAAQAVPRRRQSVRSRQAGAALLLALVAVTLIVTLAAGMVWQQQRAIQVEAAERARSQSGWILLGALDWSRLILREDGRTSNVDHAGEPWATPLAEARLSTFLAAGKDGVAEDEGPEAFLAGAIMDSDWFNQKQMDTFRHHVLLAIMPVFFLSTGLRTDWTLGGLTVLIAAALLLFAQISGKLIAMHIASRALKWEPGEASIVGWLLQTKALIEIIFANVLLDKGIITSEMFTALLLMALASTMLTVPVVTPKLKRMKEIIFRST